MSRASRTNAAKTGKTISSVVDIDKGWVGFRQVISDFSKFDVYVGWIEGKRERRSNEASGQNSASTINNATLATVHEFGTSDGRIPAGRLGFREWQDRHQQKIGDQMQAAYERSIKFLGNPSLQSSAEKELNKLGLWAVADWKQYQREVQPGPEIGESREKQIVRKRGHKGFFKSKKLVDTGQLVNGATHQLRRRVTK